MPLVDVDKILDVQTCIGHFLQPHGVTQHQRQSLAALPGLDGVGAELEDDKEVERLSRYQNFSRQYKCLRIFMIVDFNSKQLLKKTKNRTHILLNSLFYWKLSQTLFSYIFLQRICQLPKGNFTFKKKNSSGLKQYCSYKYEKKTTSKPQWCGA